MGWRQNIQWIKQIHAIAFGINAYISYAIMFLSIPIILRLENHSRCVLDSKRCEYRYAFVHMCIVSFSSFFFSCSFSLSPGFYGAWIAFFELRWLMLIVVQVPFALYVVRRFMVLCLETHNTRTMVRNMSGDLTQFYIFAITTHECLRNTQTAHMNDTHTHTQCAPARKRRRRKNEREKKNEKWKSIYITFWAARLYKILSVTIIFFAVIVDYYYIFHLAVNWQAFFFW